MNAKQLEIFIREAFQAERWTAEIMEEISPAFVDAMAEVRRIVGQLPDESLLRDVEWRRRYLPQVEQAIVPFNDALAEAVVQKMVAAGPGLEVEALNQLRAVGLVPAANALGALGAPLSDFTRMALESEVVKGTSLTRLFGYGPDRKPQTTPPFTKSNIRVINQKVATGIMNGTPTAEIANQIARAVPAPLGRRRLRVNEKGTIAHEVNAWARTIARTGIQDMNRQVHEQVWEANEITGDEWGYEWVSALDPRVCPVCAPMDGKVRDKRDDFPLWPAHFNCRCQVVLINKDEREDVRFGIEVQDQEFTYNGVPISKLTGEERKRALGSGYYASKVKVKGQRLNRKVEQFDAAPGQRRVTYGDYLAQSNKETQAAFFGGGKGGAKRAADFRAWMGVGKTPAQAMQKTIINMPGTTGALKTINPAKVRFRPLKDLKAPGGAPASTRRLPPSAPKPPVTVPTGAIKVAQEAEQKALAKLSTQMGTAELDEALKAVNTKVVAKPSRPPATDIRGIDPVNIFWDSKDSLGRGAFGEARLTSQGVVKRGWLSKQELKITEKLNDSGVTPRLLGSAYEGDWQPKLFPGLNVRRGYMLLEKAPGEPLQKMIQSGGGLTNKQANNAFESLMKARKKIHMAGVSHQDMHPGNIMYDLKSEQLTVLDFGLSRLDTRAALVEALGVMQSPIGIVGDFQSKALFTYLNKTGGVKKSEMWKRFKKNRKAVIDKLQAEGAGDIVNASIRAPLPSSATKNLSTKRALELIGELYEGI